MLKRWKQLSTNVFRSNPWWSYKIDQFQIPNGITGDYHYVETNGSSMIVPILDDGNFILVNQYRYLCEKESIEFPCGGIRKGFSHHEMALIELEEETGYHSGEIKKIGEFNPFNGVTSEICHVYIARQLKKTKERPDSTEEFEVFIKSYQEIDSLISSNLIWDGMTLAAWSLIKNKI